MDWPEFSTDKPSPRRELQGPRPTPLKVRKDSHKIKKPPIAPQASQPHHHQQHHNHQQQQPQQLRQPVIIYTISPKVIHTNASDFMSLVQRLTGPSTSTSPISHNITSPTGAISPAARFASVEKTKMPSEADKFRYSYNESTDIQVDTMIEELQMGPNVERTGLFPGILSPVPSSLPIVSPSFFSPPSDHNSFNFLHDLSPMFQGGGGNKNYFENVFAPSPSSTFLTAPITSPNLPFDLYNQFLDF